MTIRRFSLLTAQTFQAYKAASKPVLMHGAMESWRAPKYWTDDYLISAYGDESVEVMAWRDSDPKYEVNCDNHRSNMRFADYIKTVSKGESNDFYITANNGFFRRPGMQTMLQDIGHFPYLSGPRSGDNTHLWFGAAGTVTPLHYDTTDLILAQIRGRKVITMLDPGQTQYLYNSTGVFSEVDCVAPDLQRHPLYKQAKKHVVFLESWEALFIPQGWWHHVRALSTSISISFTKLV